MIDLMYARKQINQSSLAKEKLPGKTRSPRRKGCLDERKKRRSERLEKHALKMAKLDERYKIRHSGEFKETYEGMLILKSSLKRRKAFDILESIGFYLCPFIGIPPAYLADRDWGSC